MLYTWVFVGVLQLLAMLVIRVFLCQEKVTTVHASHPVAERYASCAEHMIGTPAACKSQYGSGSTAVLAHLQICEVETGHDVQ